MKKTPNKPPSPAELARVLKALPRTADGKAIYPGMAVWRIGTGDGGKTWVLSEQRTIEAVSCYGMAVMIKEGKLWEHTRPPADNRLFSTRAAALAECRRRNRDGK